MGLFEMKDLVQQARSMQKEMKKKQKELEHMKFEGASGGGMVTVIMTGQHEILSVKIDPSIVSSENVRMLEDLVRGAMTDAFQKVKKETEQQFSTFAKLGGLFG